MAEQVGVHEGTGISLIGSTLSCIQSRNADGLMARLLQLNQQLTGGGKNAHFTNEDALREVVTQLFSDLQRSEDGDADVIVYLGDGGFSRLDIGIDYDRKPFISLTDNSTPQVKEKWKIIEEEYEKVNEQQK